MARLYTLDRAIKRGVYAPNCCVLCFNEAKSHHHLFFGCDYSAYLWKLVLAKLGKGTNRNCILQNELMFLHQSFSSRNQVYFLARLAFTACIWHIWQERNNRIFKSVRREKLDRFKLIEADVSILITKCRATTKDSSYWHQVLANWGVKLIPHSKTMQRCLGASSGCLRTEAFQYNFQETSLDGGSKSGEELHANLINTMGSENTSNRDASAPPNRGYTRPFYPQEFCTWSNFHPECSQTNFGSRFHPMNREYPYPVDNRIHSMPLKMLYHSYPHEFQFQDFHYFVVIDFEATCEKERIPHPQEIIEFPSVIVNSVTGNMESCFQTYVRPSHHQHLSDFCKELTGIQQFQVDRGVPLSEALLMHDKWLESKGIKQTKFVVVTWSNWDCRVMLESECRFKRIRKPPYFNSWINLKVPFQESFGGIRCNLKDAVQRAGLVWEGRLHCGLDDARNTARLLTDLMRRGTRLCITNSLPQPPVIFNNNHRDLTVPSSSPPVQFRAFVERCPYCYCGLRSSRGMFRNGRGFFGCGNWTGARRPGCNYFAWAS